MATKILSVILFIILSVMILFILGKDNDLLAFWTWVIALALSISSFYEGAN